MLSVVVVESKLAISFVVVVVAVVVVLTFCGSANVVGNDAFGGTTLEGRTMNGFPSVVVVGVKSTFVLSSVLLACSISGLRIISKIL